MKTGWPLNRLGGIKSHIKILDIKLHGRRHLGSGDSKKCFETGTDYGILQCTLLFRTKKLGNETFTHVVPLVSYPLNIKEVQILPKGDYRRSICSSHTKSP
jgi:hypothetical protein